LDDLVFFFFFLRYLEVSITLLHIFTCIEI
jgi:hypothetical protein